MKRSAMTKTATHTISTRKSSSYRPRTTEVKEPANHAPTCWSMSVCRARNVEAAPTTAPSMMPTIGTMREDCRRTRRRKRKNTRVPMKAKRMAPAIRVTRPAPGTSTMVTSKPRPAHSVVPVVLGSTKRFCVMSCMISPHIAIEAPASTRATVRGTRVMANISRPPSAPTSYTPTNSETTMRAAVTTMPASSGQVRCQRVRSGRRTAGGTQHTRSPRPGSSSRGGASATG